MLVSLLFSLFRLEYLCLGPASELSLQLPYFVVPLVPLVVLSLSLLNASLQLLLTDPLSNLDVPFPFSNLLELPFSNLLPDPPLSNLLEPAAPLESNLLEPAAAASNLDNLSPTALSVLAVLTGLLLLYFGNEELESEEVKLVLQLGVEAAPAAL